MAPQVSRVCFSGRRLFVFAIASILFALILYLRAFQDMVRPTQYGDEETQNLIRSATTKTVTQENELRSVTVTKEKQKLHEQKVYEQNLREAMSEEKDAGGCVIPKLDPFAPEMLQFDKKVKPINCGGINWVRCRGNSCYVITPILEEYVTVECIYKDIIYKSDKEIYASKESTTVMSDRIYQLEKSDFVNVFCEGKDEDKKVIGSWSGNVGGMRHTPPRPLDPELAKVPHYNILMFGFDSTAKNGFIRKMPHSYKLLTDDMGAVVLNGYNIVGDGTPQALLPIFTGQTELELPEIRKRFKDAHPVDDLPFIWYLLRDKGYKTGYMEDMPWIGTFTYRFTGFRQQPTDFYNRPLLVQSASSKNNKKYCISEFPTYRTLMDFTEQFMSDQSSPRFMFSFSADVTHDDNNMMSLVDEEFADWLRDIRGKGILDDTILIVMGDHGPRYSTLRNTLQGKQEERLPMMSFVLPESFKKARPQAYANLRANADVLTTPFDMHATLLDIAGLKKYSTKVKIEGAELYRSMSMLDPIPKSRTCSEAGVEPHWCACLRWEAVSENDSMYDRMANRLLEYINKLTDDERNNCVPRTLTSVEWVTKSAANQKLLTFEKTNDADGYLAKFGAKPRNVNYIYQVKVIVGPGTGIYEASLTHYLETDTIGISTDDISRINPYRDEPHCISSTKPDLNMYCFCRDKLPSTSKPT